MASAELIVAKTALSGALFRPDPRPCSRDDIESMFALVNSTIAECSPSNVQRCKQWALNNLVPSSARVAAFCKYLVALAKSFGGDNDAAALANNKGRVPSARRRRLHVLYLLNDILYHVKFRNRDDAFAQKLEPALIPLVRSAGSFRNCPKHIRKIQDLIGLWEENGYFAPSFIQKLRAALEEGPLAAKEAKNEDEVDNSASAVAKAAKTAPWVMPAMHGDPSTPWYDLPAGNWLPVLEPNSTRPMNPSMIKPLVLAQGPADKALVHAAKDLLAAIDRIYSSGANHDEHAADISRLGERIEVDEITGEVIGGDTYYGWSRAFCEKMKQRGRNENRRNEHGERGRGRTSSSRSYSRAESRSRSRRRDYSETPRLSRSRSRPAFKRQRMSKSPPDRRRGRSWTSTPSDRSSPGRHKSHSYRRSRSRSASRPGRRSRSRSRSRSRAHRRQSPYGYPSRSRSRSRSRRRSPSLRPSDPYPPRSNGFPPPNPPPGAWNQQHPPPPTSFPIPPPIPPQGFGMGFPVPIPPPPTGQWPPVPPPPPGQHQHPNFFVPGGNAIPPPPFPGGWPVPPPPGPAVGNQNGPYQQGQGQSQGQGQDPSRGEYRGRGGYGRGGWQ